MLHSIYSICYLSCRRGSCSSNFVISGVVADFSLALFFWLLARVIGIFSDVPVVSCLTSVEVNSRSMSDRRGKRPLSRRARQGPNAALLCIIAQCLRRLAQQLEHVDVPELQVLFIVFLFFFINHYFQLIFPSCLLKWNPQFSGLALSRTAGLPWSSTQPYAGPPKYLPWSSTQSNAGPPKCLLRSRTQPCITFASTLYVSRHRSCSARFLQRSLLRVCCCSSTFIEVPLALGDTIDELQTQGYPNCQVCFSPTLPLILQCVRDHWCIYSQVNCPIDREPKDTLGLNRAFKALVRPDPVPFRYD